LRGLIDASPSNYSENAKAALLSQRGLGIGLPKP
jgi:hypothetical protein